MAAEGCVERVGQVNILGGVVKEENFETAFLNAQKEIRPAPKDAVNPFFKSKYTDYSTLVEAVRAPLHNHGISFRHTSSFKDGLLFVGTQLFHPKSGERSEVFELPVKMGTPQETGSAVTYVKRYSLSALCGIASDPDDDANAASQKSSGQRVGTPPTEVYTGQDKAQKNLVMKLAGDVGITNVPDLKELNAFLVSNKPKVSELNLAIDEWLNTKIEQ